VGVRGWGPAVWECGGGVQLCGSAGVGSSCVGVRGWWVVTINCHGIQVSITGGVEQMVLVQILNVSIFIFFLFL